VMTKREAISTYNLNTDILSTLPIFSVLITGKLLILFCQKNLSMRRRKFMRQLLKIFRWKWKSPSNLKLFKNYKILNKLMKRLQLMRIKQNQKKNNSS